MYLSDSWYNKPLACWFTSAGYEAPRKQSTGEFGLVRTTERTLISCPIVGVPGPAFFYWERGQDLVNRTGYVASRYKVDLSHV